MEDASAWGVAVGDVKEGCSESVMLSNYGTLVCHSCHTCGINFTKIKKRGRLFLLARIL